MIHEVPDPQPLKEVKVTLLSSDPPDLALAIQNMTMEDYEKVRSRIYGPAMVEWKQHFLKTGSLT